MPLSEQDEQVMATLERVAAEDPARVGALIAAGCGTAPEEFQAVFAQGTLAAARAAMTTLISLASALATRENAAHYEETVASAMTTHETVKERRHQVLARLEALQGELTAGQLVDVPSWDLVAKDLV